MIYTGWLQGVSYFMVLNFVKRAPGRPQAFRPEDALDRAVEMFWEHGYEGVDVERIARAVHVTKPALYREFGDKPTLLLKAVERYLMTYGAPMIAAFQSEPDIHKAVRAFCEATVNNATAEPRSGCMMAAAVLGQSERVKRDPFLRCAGARGERYCSGAEIRAGDEGWEADAHPSGQGARPCAHRPDAGSAASRQSWRIPKGASGRRAELRAARAWRAPGFVTNRRVTQ